MPATRRSRWRCRSPRCWPPPTSPTPATVDGVADFLRDTADAWNEQIEDWIYVTDTRLAHEVGVAGYYVRIAPEVPGEARAELRGTVEVRNRFAGSAHVAADELISTDALALVRFGLRAADDPRIVDTVKVIDHVLRVDLPYGPGWRRYNGDGYGEHDDGSPYDGTGIGRVWPLLAGERAHYELAAGSRAEAERLLAAMEAGASPGRLLPEQVWDGRADPGAGAGARRAERLGDAAGLGACRAHQAAALAGGRRGVRPAAAAGAALSAGEARGALPAVAAGLAHAVAYRSGACCGSTCRSRRWCTGAPMAGRPAPMYARATRGSAFIPSTCRRTVYHLAIRLCLRG